MSLIAILIGVIIAILLILILDFFYQHCLSFFCFKNDNLDNQISERRENKKKKDEEVELEEFIVSPNTEGNIKEKKHWLEANLSRSYQMIPQFQIRETSDFRQSTEQLRSLLSPEPFDNRLSNLQQRPKFFHSDSVIFKNEKKKQFTIFEEMHEHGTSTGRMKKSLNSININNGKQIASTILEDDDAFGSNMDQLNSFAVSGVYFTCTELDESLEKYENDDLQKKIKEYIQAVAQEDSARGACLKIYSLNNCCIEIQTCVEILFENLEKLIENPKNEKFHRIELNEEFEEKVLKIVGALEFLNVVGYGKEVPSDLTDDRRELTLRKEKINEESLLTLRALLKSTTPITRRIFRDLQVLMPQQVIQRCHLPLEFYQFLYNDPISQFQLRGNKMMLRVLPREKTKKERQLELEETQELSRHPFTLIRVLFPDSLTLQGTFESREKVASIYEFVKENLVNLELPYLLTYSDGEDLSQLEDSLAKRGLSPGATLHFKPSSLGSPDSLENVAFLKPQIIALVEKKHINSP